MADSPPSCPEVTSLTSTAAPTGDPLYVPPYPDTDYKSKKNPWHINGAYPVNGMPKSPDHYCSVEWQLKNQGYRAEDFGCKVVGDVDLKGPVGSFVGGDRTWPQKWSCLFDQDESGAIYKVTWDPEHDVDCCLGNLEKGDWKCGPRGCPSDPSGTCSTAMISSCSTIDDACSKSVMLLPNRPNSSCYQWYDSQRQYGRDAGLGEAIGRYCNKYPGMGECACFNYTTDVATGKRDAVMGSGAASADGSSQGLVRSDVYCVPGNNTDAYKDAYPGSHTTYCANQGVTPISPTAAAPVGVPPHCWAHDCLGSPDQDTLVDPRQFGTKCPDMCVQVSAGNTVKVEPTSQAAAFSVDALRESCSFGDEKPLGVCFSVDDSSFQGEYEELLVGGSKTKRYLNVRNLAQDTHWPSFATIPWTAYSTVPSVVSLDPSTTSGELASGGQASIGVTIDLSEQAVPSMFPVEIVLVDNSGMNDPLRVLVTVYVVANPQKGTPMPSEPTVAPSRLTRAFSAMQSGPGASVAIGGALVSIGVIGLLAMTIASPRTGSSPR